MPPSNMVRVEGGTFQMGDLLGEGQTGEIVHTVTVSTFFLSKYEVSFQEFDAFCAATGRKLPDDKGWGRGRRPVINVDWYDAIEYCNWLSQQQGLTSVYAISKETQDPDNQDKTDLKKWEVLADWAANGYRLPTEAEWEYAARQRGQKVRFGDGRDIINPAKINFDGSEEYKEPYSVVGKYRKQTVPVQSLSANKLGLKNMSGNVWEWCWDWYDEEYYDQSDNASNPTGPTEGSARICRGGSWNAIPAFCRSAKRQKDEPHHRDKYSGFRVARSR